MLSNLSAHKPAQIPAAPKIKEDKNKYKISIVIFSIFKSMNKLQTIIERNVIIIDRDIEADIIDKVTSEAERGAPIKSPIFPITFPINIEEDEWAKDWDIICIAIRPGAKKFINTTPSTFDLLSPIAKFITVKNNNAVIMGPTIVCPATDKYLKFSLRIKDWTPIQ